MSIDIVYAYLYASICQNVLCEDTVTKTSDVKVPISPSQRWLIPNLKNFSQGLCENRTYQKLDASGHNYSRFASMKLL